MKVAIMQPYFFPYIGYFQLMNLADVFVVYDNIEYTKKGWINRNRILVNGKDEYITLPLRKGSDFLQVKDRFLAETWKVERLKMLNKISACYRKAPYFPITISLIEKILMFEDDNLFNFIFHSLTAIHEYLQLPSRMIISSSIHIDHKLKSEQKVIAICKAFNAKQYINLSGGVELYSKDVFFQRGMELSFLKSANIIYPQFKKMDFIPYLSIIDVMMFNKKDEVINFLKSYTLN